MILFQVGYVQLDDPDSVEIVTKYDVAPPFPFEMMSSMYGPLPNSSRKDIFGS